MFGQLIRFAQSGAVGTAVHYAVLGALVQGGALDAVRASTLGAVSGALVNYLLNYRWTFASRLPHRYALPRYLLIAALGLGLNFLLMKWFSGGLQFHYLAAQLLSTAACLVMNFLLSRYWAFRAGDVSMITAESK